MPIETVRHARSRLKSVEDQVPADVGRIVQTSKPDLMARGIAIDLLQMAKRAGPQYEAVVYGPGRKTSPWTASLLMIEGAIKPYGDSTVELSMKAPMSVSKLVDLG